MQYRIILVFTITIFSQPLKAQLSDQILTVAKEGQGLITTRPAGLICGIACQATSATFDFGDFVEVRALPAAGWELDSWSGSCSGRGTCEVIMNASRVVGVTFTRTGPEDPPDPPPMPEPDPTPEPRPSSFIPPIIDLVLSDQEM